MSDTPTSPSLLPSLALVAVLAVHAAPSLAQAIMGSSRSGPEITKIHHLIEEGRRAEALAQATPLAEAGNSTAMNIVASLYLTQSGGVDKDHQAFASWAKRSADVGDARGQFYYGYALFMGTGVQESLHEGIAHLKKAAMKGDLFAQTLLGSIYVEDGKVRTDPDEAEKWWLMAASNGDAKGQYLLGGFYARYDLDRRDIKKAIFWTEKAARQRYAGAAQRLAQLKADRAVPEAP